jgi:hypothetical protein
VPRLPAEKNLTEATIALNLFETAIADLRREWSNRTPGPDYEVVRRLADEIVRSDSSQADATDHGLSHFKPINHVQNVLEREQRSSTGLPT